MRAKSLSATTCSRSRSLASPSVSSPASCLRFSSASSRKARSSPLLEHVAEAVAQVALGAVHVLGQVAERNLRLDHPELGQVARRVGVLRAEGGAEGVDGAEGAREVLAVQLARDGKVAWLAEEVLCVIDLARGRLLQRLLEVERRDLEHLARTLAVGAGDERRGLGRCRGGGCQWRGP